MNLFFPNAIKSHYWLTLHKPTPLQVHKRDKTVIGLIQKSTYFLQQDLFLHIIQVLQNFSISCICYCCSSQSAPSDSSFLDLTEEWLCWYIKQFCLESHSTFLRPIHDLKEKKQLWNKHWGRVTTAETWGQMPQWHLAKYFSVANFATEHTY